MYLHCKRSAAGLFSLISLTTIIFSPYLFTLLVLQEADSYGMHPQLPSPPTSCWSGQWETPPPGEGGGGWVQGIYVSSQVSPCWMPGISSSPTAGLSVCQVALSIQLFCLLSVKLPLLSLLLPLPSLKHSNPKVIPHAWVNWKN